MAYELINAQLLASVTTTVSFENIPQSYKDLLFTVNAKASVAANRYPFLLTVNDDTTNANYQRREWYDEDSVSGAEFQFDRGIGNVNGTDATNYFAVNEMQINGYASTNIRKDINGIVANPLNATTGYSNWRTGLTRTSNEAITKLSFTPSGGNQWAVGSSFCLYGLK
jgi:hypothetical protein